MSNDVEDFWEDVHPNRARQISPDLTEKLVLIAGNLGKWSKDGENAKIRQAIMEIRKLHRTAIGAEKNMTRIALLLSEQVPAIYDDPEFPDEPLNLRAWRTVEHGFLVMDDLEALNPSLPKLRRETARRP